MEARIRLSGGDSLASLTPNELMLEYLKMTKTTDQDLEALKPLIDEVIRRSRAEEEG